MRKTDKQDIWQFVVDAEQDPQKVSHIGDEYDVSKYPEMRIAFRGPIADREPAEDKWGIWLSGYAPVRNASGRAEAIVGVICRWRSYAARRQLFGSSASKHSGGVSVLHSAQPASNRSVADAGACAHTRGGKSAWGNLEFQIDLPGSDEFSDLATAFNRMMSD